eukprot:Em0003g305a
METWAEAKQINNDSEMRARIGGVAKQMESFDFFFGLELGRIVFSMSDNLSKALQGSSISASEGQSLMKMTLVAFQAIRSEDSFSVFWTTIERKRQLCKAVLIADPSLPRQRKVPKHLEIGSSAPEFANIVEDVYRKAYYDFVVQSIKDRFDQNGYKMLSKLEELLCDSESQRDGKLSSSTVDKAFIVTGFPNWKDAIIRFKNHESSGCHREAVERAITLPKVTKDIGELLSEAHSKEKRDNRECLLKILSRAMITTISRHYRVAYDVAAEHYINKALSS